MKTLTPKIYTVTTLYLDPKNPHGKFQKDYRKRTWGFYYSLKDAIRGMKMSCSDEAGHYNYCVIERYSPGIYAVQSFEKWYKWNEIGYGNNSWVLTEKPENCKQIINFAIG